MSDDSSVIHKRLTGVESSHAGLRASMDAQGKRIDALAVQQVQAHQSIMEALKHLESRLEKRTQPATSTWIAGAGVLLLVFGSFVGLLTSGISEDDARQDALINRLGEIAMHTNSTRFTDADGKELREMIHSHEAQGGHSSALARISRLETQDEHRRDATDAAIQRFDAEILNIWKTIAGHGTHVEDRP